MPKGVVPILDRIITKLTQTHLLLAAPTPPQMFLQINIQLAYHRIRPDTHKNMHSLYRPQGGHFGHRLRPRTLTQIITQVHPRRSMGYMAAIKFGTAHPQGTILMHRGDVTPMGTLGRMTPMHHGDAMSMGTLYRIHLKVLTNYTSKSNMFTSKIAFLC